MEFRVTGKKLTLGGLSEAYADVQIHLQKHNSFTTVKAHKVILASYSKYFHKLFQSSNTSGDFHLHFIGNMAAGIDDVLKLFYEESVRINDRHSKSIHQILKLLEVDYETSDSDKNVQNIKSEKKRKLSVASVSKSPTIEEPPTDIGVYSRQRTSILHFTTH